MAPARKAVAALRREEGGLTLIEMLVAATLGLLVIGGAMTMLLSAVRSEPRTAAQVSAIQQARVAADRIVRELRQGREVPSLPSSSSSHLEIVTYVKGSNCAGEATSIATPCRVIYDCEGATCSRAVAQPDGTDAGAATIVATDLADPEIFSYSPSQVEPDYVGVELGVANEGGDPIVLDDGAALRNIAEEEEGA